MGAKMWKPAVECTEQELRLLKLCRKQKIWSFLRNHRQLILDDEVLPANRREYEGAQPLLERLEENHTVEELHIDRGYLPAESVHERRHKSGLTVISKPPTPRTTGRFTKLDFEYSEGTLTCPNGVSRALVLGQLRYTFPVSECRACPVRSSCLTDKAKRGRQITLHPEEAFHRQMAAELATPEGRQKRRERIPVEHALARVGAIQGLRARFWGLDKNPFDLERVAVVTNLYVLARLVADEAA